MIHHLALNGKIGLVALIGALSTVRSRRKFVKKIIEDDLGEDCDTTLAEHSVTIPDDAVVYYQREKAKRENTFY